MFSTFQVLSGKQPDVDWKSIQESLDQPEKNFLVPYQIDYQELNFGKELGQGSFGIVYKGSYQFGHVAIKKLQIGDNLSPAAQEEFRKEAEMMSQLRHPNIVHFYGYCSVPRCLVMEYMPKGSLFSVVQDKEQALDWNVRIRIAIDMVSGLAFLHSKNILHRDIKSLNVLLDDQKAKLSDFGLSKVKSETKSLTKGHKKKELEGTLPWIAPELFDKEQYTYKSDIYSLGITFWELASRKVPYAEDVAEAIPVFVSRGKRETIPEDCPEKLTYLIQQCWAGDPNVRPTASNIAKFMTTDAKTLQEMSHRPAVKISDLIPDVHLHLEASPASSAGTLHVRRGSEKLNLTDKKEEQEKIYYVLEQLRTFFREGRDIGTKTENYAVYNEYLKKVHDAELTYNTAQNKHILYVNDEPVDAGTAAREISKILKLLATASVVAKPTTSSAVQSPIAVNANSIQAEPRAAAFTALPALKINQLERRNPPSPGMLAQFFNWATKPSAKVNTGGLVSDLGAAISLIEAIKQNNQEAVFRLLNLKRDHSGKRFIDETDAEHNGSPLYWAARGGYVHFIDPLLKAGAEVNKQNNNGETPIYIAAWRGHTEIIRALQAAGANVDIPNQNGKTPVYAAAQNGHAKAIAMLKITGANVNTPNKNGATPVYIAAQNGHVETITALGAAGANMDKPNKNGATPVYIAAQNGRAEAITALKAAGANMDKPKDDSDTPLCKAAENGHVATIIVLLEAGANASIKTKWGTALQQAMAGRGPGHQEAVRLLEAHFKQYPNGIKPSMVMKQEEVPPLIKPSSSFVQKRSSMLT